jgi:S-adenosylmethionine-diacylglycerol 3-amino-3-carboxypropyl transferase
LILALPKIESRAMTLPTLRDKLDNAIFGAIYSRSLVYNTCWEDPAVDRMALGLGPQDVVLVITSAGCNVLDYSLQGPRQVHAVDANPRQTALLELKIAAIRELEFSDFFAVFGDGFHADFGSLYKTRLRRHLSAFARQWWDRHWHWFVSSRGSFYFHGLSGLVARGFRSYFRLRPRLGRAMQALFQAEDLAEQRAIYDQHVAPLLWNRVVNWMISRQLTMSLIGVPHPQRKLVQAQHAKGLSGFIRDAVQYVFRQMPLADNYFWRVYVCGRYQRSCCPEYLKEANFAALKAGLVERISLHTCTITQFLQNHEQPISRFVLLDHMDWMSTYHPQALVEEWEAIIRRAAPGARILLRSAQARPAFLDRIRVGQQARGLREIFRFRDDVADALQVRDRVHTYAGFVIADAPA